MKIKIKSNRRDFLKVSATTVGGLYLGFNWSGAGAMTTTVVDEALIASGGVDFNSFLSIGANNIITIFSPNPEIGQGIKTAFPIIVAEELDVDWEKVKVVQAPLDNKKFQRQLTGGSGAIPHSWQRLREAGATARQMIIEAAAKKWKVEPATIITEKGLVSHKKSKKTATYGELASEAAKIPVPTNVKLKEAKDFKLIGSSINNVDNKEIITGKPIFGIDFYREGMLHAAVKRPPAFGLKLKSFDATEVKKMPGVVDVVSYENNVAVVGKSTWQVMKAKDALKVEYEKEGNLESTNDHNRIFRELLESREATVRRKDGDVEEAFKRAAKIVTSEYQCPFLPHTPLEPMNFFAHVKEDSVELVGPTQTPDSAKGTAASISGISPEKITVELTRMGGGFGRRLYADYVRDAVFVSKLTKSPVKVTYTREDDMVAGIYRPAVRYRFSAALDDGGNVIGYKLRGVGMNSGNPTREHNFPSGAVDNLLIDSVEHKSPITTGAWRAPITNFLAFAEQSFLDEVALAAGKDPVQFRLELLEKAKKSPAGEIKYDIDRMIGVIKLAAEKADWGKKPGIYQGFSVYYSHLSYVAQVGEVVMESGKPKLKKITAGVDCGIVVNMSGARQQVIGGIVDGYGHAMYSNLSFVNGEPEQKNFTDYRLIRMREIPEVDVHFTNNGITPTGLGEPALPPTGAAVANAIFQATNHRLREQPFIEHDIFKGVI
jgi:isoquinoline 1-oxidoreductase subunit beta